MYSIKDFKRDLDRSGAIPEFFSAGKSIGWAYLPAEKTYKETSRVCIRYSKNGWHAFPAKEADK